MGSESAATKEAQPGEAPPLEAGEILDERYKVVDVLGTGGVGIVYRAEHLGLKREVAVKVLRESFVQHNSLRPRFDREARAMAAMSHPNIVSVMDYGVTDGSPYIAMELLEGRTVRELMNEGPVPEEEALRIARMLLRGLGYAHARGLVHRDVKPGNVFLQSLDAQGEHIKLLDFGFAKIQAGSDLTTGSMISAVDETFGTPAYMAPEQAMGDHLDHRADLYSVGIVLFEMLAGDKPFDGDLHEIVKGHLAAPVPPIEEYRPDIQVRPPLMALLRKAMAKNPKDRFASADEMMTALEVLPRDSLVPKAIWEEEVAAKEAVEAEQEEHIAKSVPPPPLEPDGGRQQMMAFVGVALVVGVVGLVVMNTTGANEDEGAVAEQEPARVQFEVELPTRQEGSDRRSGPDDEGRRSRPQADGERSGSEPVVPPRSESESESATEREAESESRREAEEVLHMVDPWHLHPDVPLLESVREQLDAGRRPTARSVQQLRAYSRGNRADPRPHVLLARSFAERHWWSDAVARFALAYEVDPRIAEDPVMRDALMALAANPNVARRARPLVIAIYGEDAVPQTTD